ncbi:MULTISPECIES: restriction endonuclease subunit S [Pseudomonas]|uniref:restriction endonuclease subunit S n=1 Tax=Pseudomonas TaxID=286 RepID=UPI000D5D2642|nr:MULTISPECIES: restriction endonuclease subunit S [Pseudomonas]PWB37068.1 restriction endonuclease subunit S [Pseudomonas sp. NDM]
MSFDLPTLPQGWSYVPLEQLAQKNSVTYGVVQPGTHVEHGVPIVRVNNFKEGRVELSDLMRIDPEIEKKYGRTRLQGGEVLLTVVGSVGQVAVVSEAHKGFNVARAVAVIHPQQQVDPNWLALCLRSPLSQHLLGSRANTTVQTTINLKDLRALPVPMAPEYERGKIIELIGSLDDRITLLRETNATLEAIAQALFKSWFVDFDPVRAKAEGLEPEGMDAATAALFPDSFEESELGLVPMGWKAGCVADIAVQKKGSVNPLASPNEWFEHYSLPAFDSGQSPVLEHGESIKSNKTPLPEEVVLLSKLNPHILRVWLPVKHGKNAVCSTEFLAYSPKAGGSKELIYCLFSSAEFQQQLCQLVTGTSNSHQRVKPGQVLKLRLAIADDSLFIAFADIASPIFERVYANRLKAKTLTQLRDALLPRLISGQLRLPETEASVENMLSVAV